MLSFCVMLQVDLSGSGSELVKWVRGHRADCNAMPYYAYIVCAAPCADSVSYAALYTIAVLNVLSQCMGNSTSCQLDNTHVSSAFLVCWLTFTKCFHYWKITSHNWK